MHVQEVKAKSILRTQKKIDSWFLSSYGMNLYRGCTHNCIYCDGRSEKYQVTGDFGSEVQVKINAPDLICNEISARIRRKTLKKGYIMIGGGVGDSYQPVEKKYQLTRKTLQYLLPFNLPIHILTKSNVVTRDIDILHQLKEQNKLIISFSFSSTNDYISSFLEPGVPLPSERLNTIQQLKKEGFSCGVILLPVIPFLTDTAQILTKTIDDFSKVGVDFIIFGGLTLKTGIQKTYFYTMLKEQFPDLLPPYHLIYKNNLNGNAVPSYQKSINESLTSIMKYYKIPLRIPPLFYKDILDENDRVIVILEHLDYLLQIQGKKTPYGYAAYQLSRISEPLKTKKYELRNIKGIGPVTERLIIEILETGSSQYYEQLLY